MWNRVLLKLPLKSHGQLILYLLRIQLTKTKFLFNTRELTQQRRWQLWKGLIKSEFALLQTSSRLFHLVQFVKCWQFFLEMNFKRLYRSSGKEKESCCLVFTFSTKQEIRHFQILVVQWRQRNVQKIVMHVHSCCFTNRNLLLFCRSRSRRRRRCV